MWTESTELNVMFWFFISVHTQMRIGASMVEMSLDLCKNMVDIICVDVLWTHKSVVQVAKIK